MSEPHPSRPARPDPFGQPRPPAAPRSGQRYRFRTVALHLDPHRVPRRYRIGPAGRPPLEVVFVPRRVRLADAGLHAVFPVLVALVSMLLSGWRGEDSGILSVVLASLAALTFLCRYPCLNVPAAVAAGSDWVGSGAGAEVHVGAPVRDHPDRLQTGVERG